MDKHNEENKNQELNISDEIYNSFKDISMWYLLLLFLIVKKPRISNENIESESDNE